MLLDFISSRVGEQNWKLITLNLEVRVLKLSVGGSSFLFRVGM